MFIKPLIVDWKGLRAMGWRFSRTHTTRLMYDKSYGDDPFPRPHPLTSRKKAHLYWRVAEVLAYFEAHGLKVTEDWFAP